MVALHPSPQAELSLATDPSDSHISGVMQQNSGDHWRPLGFFSRKFTTTESPYSTFDRELLAARSAIRHFSHFSEGRVFQLWTDHKPLVTALSCISVPISPQQQRHLALTSELNVLACCCCFSFTPTHTGAGWKCFPPWQRQI